MTDKVKMSLERYEGLKQRIADLEAENRELNSQVEWFNRLFNMIDIPIDMVKDLGTDDVSVEQYYDPAARVTTRMVRINAPGDWREYE